MSIGVTESRPGLAILRTLAPVAKILVGALVLASIAGAGRQLMGSVSGSAARFDWLPMAVALAATIGYRAANAAAWGLILRAIDQRLPILGATRIWLLSEACRWLPGGLWNLGSRAALASRAGVPVAAVGSSLGLELLVTIASWALLALVGLAPFPEAPEVVRSRLGWAGPMAAVGVGVAGLVATAAVLAGRLPGVAARLRGAVDRVRQAARLRPRWLPMAGAFASYTSLGAINGLAFLLVIRAVAPGSDVPALAAIGVNAAAWLIGFFAVFAPGGLVVREGAAAALLVAWMPLETGLLAAAAWRLVQIASELACLGPLALRRRARPGEGGPMSPTSPEPPTFPEPTDEFPTRP
jgi:hypothetical protein